MVFVNPTGKPLKIHRKTSQGTAISLQNYNVKNFGNSSNKTEPLSKNINFKNRQ